MFRDLSLTLFNNTEALRILITCVCAFGAIWLFFSLFKDKPEEKEAPKEASSFLRLTLSSRKFTLKDIRNCLIITVLFAVVGFWQLGSFHIPHTTWQPSSDYEMITFEVTDENPAFDTVYAIAAEGDNNNNPDTYQIGTRNIQLVGSNDGENWTHITLLNDDSSFSYMAYQVFPGDWNFRYIGLVCQDKNDALTEIAFKKTGSTDFLTLEIDSDTDPNNPYSAELLIDEIDQVAQNSTYMDQTFFDEIYHVRNANEIANGEYMYASVHPLFGTTLIALGIKLLGNNPFGWRFMGMLFSVFMLPLVYALLHKLFKNTYLSTFGTTLLAADFMHFTTGRIGTLEPFSVFFIVLMFFFMVGYLQTNFNEGTMKKPYLYLALSGITMGFAISTKWTGCYAAVGLAILFFVHLYQRYTEYKKAGVLLKKAHSISSEEMARAQFVRDHFKERIIKVLLWCCLFFVAIPVFTYWVSYIPTLVWREGWSVQNVFHQILGMYSYHANLEATHPFSSVWYQWLFDIRPIWYYSGSTGDLYHTISCFNNPLISWVGVVAMVITLVQVFTKKDRIAFMIAIGYLSSLIPWVLVTRCVFAYHYYPAYPFLILSIVYVAKLLLQKDLRYKRILTGFAIVCCVLFFYFLPVTSGMGTHISVVNQSLRWFESWYFGA